MKTITWLIKKIWFWRTIALILVIINFVYAIIKLNTHSAIGWLCALIGWLFAFILQDIANDMYWVDFKKEQK